jgi:monofunctional glycosyltransferase
VATKTLKPKASRGNSLQKALARTGVGGGSRKSSGKKGGFFKRLGKRILQGVLIFFVVTFGLVLLFRWVDPLFTPLMAIRKAGAILEGKPSEVHYQWMSIDEMDPDLPLAVVASEDQLFPKHWGFDFKQINKAYHQNQKGKKVYGASTISQQVAKNLFLWPGRSFVRKGLEAYFTCLMELTWPKKRILEMYLNIAETGELTFGMPAAMDRNFKGNARKVNRVQASLLAATLPNPREYSARKPTPYMLKRSGHIMLQMQLLGGKSYLKDIL